jgi:iron complex transport system substrate-binding protein
MTSRIRTFIFIALLGAFSAHSDAQFSIKDDVGRPILLRSSAKRIVTLSPWLTELVYAAGAGDLVVGVDSLSDYPPEAKKAAQVATGAQLSIDVLAGLKPDLVLAWRDGIKRDDIDRIAAFGTTVFVASARNLADIPRLLEVVGRMTGRDTSAAVSEFELRLERVRRANAGKVRMTAFLEIWNRPLTTISGKHFLSEALEICRAENVFRDAPGTAPKVTWDDLFKEDPYVIIGAGSASSVQEFRSNWAMRQSLSAVKAERLIYLESDAVQRPTTRTPEGIEELCATLDKVRYTGVGIPAPGSQPQPVVIAPTRGAPSAATVAPAKGSLFSTPGYGAAPAPRPAAAEPPPKPAVASTPPAPSASVPAAPSPPPPPAPPPAAAAKPEIPPKPSQYGM